MNKEINFLITLPPTLKMAKKNFIKRWLPDKWESYYWRKKVMKDINRIIQQAIRDSKE